MKKIILPDGRELCYELTRKRVKNINFRVKDEEVVMVSAPSGISVKYIEQCLAKRADLFFGAFEKLRARNAAQIKSTETVNWLGKELPIIIIENSRETAVFDENECRVFTKDFSAENVQNLIRAAKVERFKALCAELNEQVRAGLKARGLEPPPALITIKEMKSRWGSCSYAKGHISINLRLADFPRETVLSVFWHEYAHFWHHDHSDRFYRFLLDLYPDYYKHNNVLKAGIKGG